MIHLIAGWFGSWLITLLQKTKKKLFVEMNVKYSSRSKATENLFFSTIGVLGC